MSRNGWFFGTEKGDGSPTSADRILAIHKPEIVGDCGVVAWYTVSASITSVSGADDQFDATLTANAVDSLEYDVIVNPVIEEVTNADIKANSAKGLYLSDWNDGHTGLVTKINQNGSAVVDANFTEGTTGVLYRVFKVSLYLSHTTPFSDAQMTEEEWEDLVDASSSTVDFAFAYQNAAVGADEVEITADHMPFYYKAQTSGAVTYMNYALEVGSATDNTPVTTFTSPAIKDISKNSAAPTQVGYLYMRIDGGSWNIDHSKTKTYKGTILLDEAA